jgi:hypothetical protein
MRDAWSNAVLVHLPVHASWLYQVKIYFSILQRKAIASGDFADLEDLAQRILAFQNRYNQPAEPATTSTATSTASTTTAGCAPQLDPRRTSGDDH